MKKIVFVVVVLLSAIATGFAQGKIPTAVSTAFNQKFANASHVSWDKENAHEYEASFQLKGVSYSANFSDSGEWLETESPITFDQLPEKVRLAFNASHKGATVKAVAKIETSEGNTKYEVEILQGLKRVELFYDAAGNEVSE